VRRTVAYATGRAYLAIYAQKLVIVVDEQARDTAKSHFDYAHQRFAGGVGTRLDEVRARQEVATDEALVQEAYAQLEADEEALGIVVGIDGPLDTSEEPALAEPPSLKDALVDATHRTDIVALAAKARVTERAVKDSWSDYAPSLQGIASPFYQTPPVPNIPMTGYELGLGLTVPFYDGGLRYGLANERKALNSEAMIAYQAGLRQAESDVRTAFEALKRADSALQQSREAARLAAEALELANVAYRGGAVTNLEVIDAERQARDAATQAEIAADTQRQARLAMLTATGRFP
jgi:outer membrane protein TolC